jgi:hypothetical protein
MQIVFTETFTSCSVRGCRCGDYEIFWDVEAEIYRVSKKRTASVLRVVENSGEQLARSKHYHSSSLCL